MFPAIGKRPIRQLTAPHVVALAQAIEARGALDIAKRSWQTIGQILRYAAVADANATGDVAAMRTAWGGFPPYGLIGVAERMRRIGEGLDNPGADARRTIVYPEAVIGLYDSSLDDLIELEIVRKIRQTGQTVVLGADVHDGAGRFRNIALVLRPDGSRSIVSARQTTPLAQWRPWSNGVYFPADWLGNSTVKVSDNLRARIMFCHEEWMPALHLLSEAREEHRVVIATANLWAAEDALAEHVQGAHTQGMALLFGRRVARAVNGPAINWPG